MNATGYETRLQACEDVLAATRQLLTRVERERDEAVCRAVRLEAIARHFDRDGVLVDAALAVNDSKHALSGPLSNLEV